MKNSPLKTEDKETSVSKDGKKENDKDCLGLKSENSRKGVENTRKVVDNARNSDSWPKSNKVVSLIIE